MLISSSKLARYLTALRFVSLLEHPAPPKNFSRKVAK